MNGYISKSENGTHRRSTQLAIRPIILMHTIIKPTSISATVYSLIRSYDSLFLYVSYVTVQECIYTKIHVVTTSIVNQKQKVFWIESTRYVPLCVSGKYFIPIPITTTTNISIGTSFGPVSYFVASECGYLKMTYRFICVYVEHMIDKVKYCVYISRYNYREREREMVYVNMM